MQVITDEKEYDEIWDRIYSQFCFDSSKEDWLSLPHPNRKYTLDVIWTHDQEKLINGIFKRMCHGEMYALDRQHDCFIFSPEEDIPPDYWYHDEERDCNVYFPCYYPDGDYHFFVLPDLSCGLFGHPWRKEIYVMGDSLIKEFERYKDELGIK